MASGSGFELRFCTRFRVGHVMSKFFVKQDDLKGLKFCADHCWRRGASIKSAFLVPFCTTPGPHGCPHTAAPTNWGPPSWVFL